MNKAAADGKKRRKFNIVDAVILVVIALLIVFVVWKVVVPNSYVSDYQKITYTVRVEAIPKTMYDGIKKNMPSQLVSSGEYVDGSVISAESFPCQVETIEDSYGNTVVPGQDYVTAIFTVTANVDMNALTTKVGTQEVRTGREHIVKTRFFEVDGYIETIEWPQ